jgi:hypothetical protein
MSSMINSLVEKSHSWLMIDLSLNGQFRVCSTNLRKEETALTDANRKRENSFK